MKMKKLLLLALIIRAFSADTAHAAWEWPDLKTGVEIAASSIAAVSGSAMMYFQYKSTKQAQETHAMSVENHKLDKTSKIQNQNTAYLASLKEIHVTLTEASKRKKSDKKLEDELKANEKALQNFRAFTSQGKFDKEVYNPETTYEAKDLEKIKDDEKKATDTKKPDTSKQPGFFRKTANAIMVPVSLAQSAANKVADILPVNALLGRIAEHESLKGTFFDTHKRDIGGVLVTATIAALSYKAYSWYYNEARITASETITELEEQAKLIAAQYKQEMKRTDLSAEDKAKLKKACIQYMKQLKENIRQQKIAAGYNVYRNLLIGAVVTAVGLPVLIKYYPDELKKMFSYAATTPQETEIKTDTTTSSDSSNQATPSENQPTLVEQKKGTQSTPVAQENSDDQTAPTKSENSQEKSQENSSETNSQDQSLLTRIHYDDVSKDWEWLKERCASIIERLTYRSPEQTEPSTNDNDNSQKPQDSQD